jgi:hypothetical protein
MTYAEREIDILLKTTDDAIIKGFVPEILKLVEKFNDSGQSGGSAPYTAGAISSAVKKLCLHEPICPITGIDEEWSDIAESMGGRDEIYQNKRCGCLFKDGKDNNPYYLDGIVFQGEDNYDAFTGTVEEISSRQFIKEFPFEPKTFYIDVRRELYDEEKHGSEDDVIVSGGSDGDYVYFIKDRKQLDEVYEHYDKEGNWKKKQRSIKLDKIEK